MRRLDSKRTKRLLQQAILPARPPGAQHQEQHLRKQESSSWPALNLFHRQSFTWLGRTLSRCPLALTLPKGPLLQTTSRVQAMIQSGRLEKQIRQWQRRPCSCRDDKPLLCRLLRRRPTWNAHHLVFWSRRDPILEPSKVRAPPLAKPVGFPASKAPRRRRHCHTWAEKLHPPSSAVVGIHARAVAAKHVPHRLPDRCLR